jgi:hypothetical protein
MEDLISFAEYFGEEDAWVSSYQGDPLVRPHAYVFEILVNDVDLMKDWLDAFAGSYEFAKVPERRSKPEFDKSFTMCGNTFYFVTIRIFEKKKARLFKARFW